MSLFISSVFTYDEDAGNYIQAVEAADAQALEPATRKAINNFVIGCKQDGIWTAIKASCILAGARTLAGALVPLAGTAPTNVGGLFVAGDYNRKTGLVGDGSTKYLNSNRRANDDPQNSLHFTVYKTNTSLVGAYLGTITVPLDLLDNEGGVLRCFARSNGNVTPSINMTNVTGFMGFSRESSSVVVIRGNSALLTGASNSSAPSNVFLHVFARSANNTPNTFSGARLAFYSIGESLDLARLDGRVTDLINAFAVTIP